MDKLVAGKRKFWAKMQLVFYALDVCPPPLSV